LKKKVTGIDVEKIKKEQQQDGFLSPASQAASEGISPEVRSKTHLAMKPQDLKQIESKVRNHIKTKQNQAI
jgi:hypothetical protein